MVFNSSVPYPVAVLPAETVSKAGEGKKNMVDGAFPLLHIVLQISPSVLHGGETLTGSRWEPSITTSFSVAI